MTWPTIRNSESSTRALKPGTDGAWMVGLLACRRVEREGPQGNCTASTLAVHRTETAGRVTMALVNCGECGREVSTKAPACPNCGAPVSETATTPSKKYVTNRKCKSCGARLKKVGAARSIASGQAPGPFGLSWPVCRKCGKDNRYL